MLCCCCAAAGATGTGREAEGGRRTCAPKTCAPKTCAPKPVPQNLCPQNLCPKTSPHVSLPARLRRHTAQQPVSGGAVEGQWRGSGGAVAQQQQQAPPCACTRGPLSSRRCPHRGRQGPRQTYCSRPANRPAAHRAVRVNTACMHGCRGIAGLTFLWSGAHSTWLFQPSAPTPWRVNKSSSIATRFPRRNPRAGARRHDPPPIF